MNNFRDIFLRHSLCYRGIYCDWLHYKNKFYYFVKYILENIFSRKSIKFQRDISLIMQKSK